MKMHLKNILTQLNANDAEKETFRFDLGACVIDFDFAKIWS